MYSYASNTREGADHVPGKIFCTSINPDQVVAEGAAIRAAMISGVDHEMLRDVLMMDVLPSRVGIEAANGDFVPLLKRLSKIPCKATNYLGHSR